MIQTLRLAAGTGPVEYRNAGDTTPLEATERRICAVRRDAGCTVEGRGIPIIWETACWVHAGKVRLGIARYG